uniref:B30.2/SPRY domain-containing protein n=1 Tax=Seriola dumerili TaxID=41447 RepID=A0A3B4T9I4_SERDU
MPVGVISSDILVVTSLGRPFTLGMLYDARQDRLIPGFTLWDNDVLKESIVDCPQPSSTFKMIASDSVEDTSSLFDVEKYQNQSRVMLQYKATTNFKLLMTNFSTKHIEYSESFENIQATHVVIVDASNKIPSVEISGQGAVQLTNEENALTNNLSCRFHGNMFLACNPKTFEDAKAVPMTVWLVQLTNFYSRAPQMAADGSTPKLRKVHSILEAIRQLEMRCKESLEDKRNFQNLCNESMMKVFEDNLRSPFKIKSLNKWLECEEREINIIRSCTDIIEGAKAKTVSSKNEMIRELLESKVQNPKKLRPPANDYWYTSDDIPEMMREKAHLFCNLAKYLKTQNVKQEGVGIHWGGLIDEFNRPYMPPVETIQARRELLWYDCELTLDSDTVYPVLTLSEDNKKQQVLCKEGLSGRHYREVEWLGYVCAGVTYRGIRTKTWAMDTRLGVYLDWPAGTLSYYMLLHKPVYWLQCHESSITEWELHSQSQFLC